MTFTPLKGPTPLIKDYLGDKTIAELEDGPVEQQSSKFFNHENKDRKLRDCLPWRQYLIE